MRNYACSILYIIIKRNSSEHMYSKTDEKTKEMLFLLIGNNGLISDVSSKYFLGKQPPHFLAIINTFCFNGRIKLAAIKLSMLKGLCWKSVSELKRTFMYFALKKPQFLYYRTFTNIYVKDVFYAFLEFPKI